MQIKESYSGFVEYKASSRGTVLRTFTDGTSIVQIGGGIVRVSPQVVGEQNYPLKTGQPVMVDVADDGETVVSLAILPS